eukprot:GFUD01038765.1.p1 GENE.GFUD01038765.1~~GFUD01038765.1.p1  ORF type:complete len:425 (+),score=155.39 GFUD01038765.1:899-2173(+)
MVLTIAMVSDFFYPNMGGVESHIFQVSQCLIERGHRVLVVTHAYGDRVGVRYMTNMLKVFYLPIMPFYNKSVLPTIVCSLPYLRHILLTEKVDLVHGHSAFSSLAHEALLVGTLLNLPTVFTDHSLFGFSDASAIVTNTFLKFSLANTSHTICVSHTGKENTVLRSSVVPERVSVIPNAVDSVAFRPPKVRRNIRSVVTVVLGSRLVYRKGVDLVVEVLPKICRKKFGGGRVRVDFIIAGDGPKRILFEEMIEKHGLQARVVMLGELQHSEMRDKLLAKGDIFLNTSLTEAFCMAIVEAASCGLSVVSTAVGGIPEVLPDQFIYFVQPSVGSIKAGLERAVEDVITGDRPDPWEGNCFVSSAFNWRNVAARTERVYETVCGKERQRLATRVRNMWEGGTVAGPIMAMLYLACHYFILLLDWCES